MLKKYALIFLIVSTALFTGIYLYTQGGRPAGGAEPGTIAYRDLTGKTIRITKDVKRIVLLRSKDIYELAALLGDELPARLVAWGPDLKTDDRQSYDRFLEKYPALKDLPETGNINNDELSPRQLVELQPDLVIADKFMIDRGYKYMDKLREAGLPVVYLDGSSDPWTGPQKGIRLLGKILGRDKRAEEIVRYVDARLTSLLTSLAAIRGPIPSIYLETGSGGPLRFAPTYGSSGSPKTYTSWGAILNKLRVRNIADGVVAQKERMDPAYVLQSDPDVIVITGQDWTASGGSMKLGYTVSPPEARQILNGFAGRQGWSSLSAVRNKRCYSVFHNTAIILCFASIEALAKDVYPTVFVRVNPQKDLEEFYARFLPVRYSGTWMTSLE